MVDSKIQASPPQCRSINVSTHPRILAISGSLRQHSCNKILLKIAAAGAREAGAEVTMLELNDLPLPLYNQDIEDSTGEPVEVVELKKIFMAHQGLLVASPEYNGSLTAALKNLIDWVSRGDQQHPPLACFAGKVAGIMSVSPGKMGGSRGLMHLRTILQGIKVQVLAHQICIADSSCSFNEEGGLVEPSFDQGTRMLGSQVAHQIKEAATSAA